MKIAVIGWGSLIWDARNLRIASLWHKDGPKLPIEFARISSGPRLTLVIYRPYLLTQYAVTTYWSLSAIGDRDDAIRNLKDREGNPKCPVHYLERGGQSDCPDADIRACVGDWIDAHGELDAAIWTGLESNWTGPLDEAEVVNYLRELGRTNMTASSRAEEYIRKTPAQIRTPYRRVIEAKLGWRPLVLPETFFEIAGDQGATETDRVWNRVLAHQGETFWQIRGGEFTYIVRGNAVYPDRTNRHMSRKNFDKALERMPFLNTVPLQDLQGPSYVFAIMTDPRITG
jgi:hypothetical protein